MTLRNRTKEIVVAERVGFCRSAFAKARGLMFARRVTGALVFVFRKDSWIHIHTWFVWFPIDVLWLDGDKTVIQLQPQLRPFRMCCARGRARYLVELAAGVLEETGTAMGDRLSF